MGDYGGIGGDDHNNDREGSQGEEPLEEPEESKATDNVANNDKNPDDLLLQSYGDFGIAMPDDRPEAPLASKGKAPVSGNKIPKGERSMNHSMTREERVRLLGVRAAQIRGAPIMIDVEGLAEPPEPLYVTMLEFSGNKIPLVIRRFNPDGSYEDWTCAELQSL